MRRLLIVPLVVMLALAAPAWARSDREIIRNQDGQRVGTVEQGIGDRRVIRDEQGRRVGTIEPGVGGRQIIRDQDGSRTGTVEKR